jgi:uncharacterized protein (DUF2249 family)
MPAVKRIDNLERNDFLNIRFSHSFISSKFRDGKSVEDKISNDAASIIPRLLVFRSSDGSQTSFNNRRLYAFKNSEEVLNISICEANSNGTLLAVNKLSKTLRLHKRVKTAFALCYQIDEGFVVISLEARTLKHELEHICARQPKNDFPLIGVNEMPDIRLFGQANWTQLVLSDSDYYSKSEIDITNELIENKHSIYTGWYNTGGLNEASTFTGSLKSFPDSYIEWFVNIFEGPFPHREFEPLIFKKVSTLIRKEKVEITVDDAIEELSSSFSIDAKETFENRDKLKKDSESKTNEGTMTIEDAFIQTNSIDFHDEWFFGMMDKTEDIYFVGVNPTINDIDANQHIISISNLDELSNLQEKSYFKMSNYNIFKYMIDEINENEKLIKEYEDHYILEKGAVYS